MITIRKRATALIVVVAGVCTLTDSASAKRNPKLEQVPVRESANPSDSASDPDMTSRGGAPSVTGAGAVGRTPSLTATGAMASVSLQPEGMVVRGGGPSNDLCENAIPISNGDVVSGSTAGADSDGSASCGLSEDSPDVWYLLSAECNGVAHAETCGSSYDTVLSVHTGCPGDAGNEIVCNDDFCGLQSGVDWAITAGTTYMIRVSGFSGGAGDFMLTVDKDCGGGFVFDNSCGDNVWDSCCLIGGLNENNWAVPPTDPPFCPPIPGAADDADIGDFLVILDFPATVTNFDIDGGVLSGVEELTFTETLRGHGTLGAPIVVDGSGATLQADVNGQELMIDALVMITDSDGVVRAINGGTLFIGAEVNGDGLLASGDGGQSSELASSGVMLNNSATFRAVCVRLSQLSETTNGELMVSDNLEMDGGSDSLLGGCVEYLSPRSGGGSSPAVLDLMGTAVLDVEGSMIFGGDVIVSVGASVNASVGGDFSLRTTSNTTFDWELGSLNMDGGGAGGGGILAFDQFDYVGALTDNGWVAHSGGGNKVIMADGSVATLEQSDGSGEDVNLSFPAQMATDKTYAAFDLNLPAADNADIVNVDANGMYFFHLKNAGFDFRARTGVVAPTGGGDYYGLAINADSSGLGDGATWADDLSFDTTYRVVVSWDAATGESQLWLDPSSEGDTSIAHTGGSTGTLIDSVALRQSNDYTGMQLIDNVIAGEAFSDVVEIVKSQKFEQAGEDLGLCVGGFEDNFAMDTLHIEDGAAVVFVNEFDNIPGEGFCEVLYVHTLILGKNAIIDLGECNVYYETMIDCGALIDDSGAGSLIEIISCDGDANCDGSVDPLDSGFVLARFGCSVGTGDPGCDAADQNGDGEVDPLDSGYVLARFGDCELPSPPPTSACCIDGLCSEETEGDCNCGGGIYQGDGTTCESTVCPIDVCGPGNGDCCLEGGNGTPGCDDEACCDAICAANPFCCDTEWDQICADAAIASPSCDCDGGPGNLFNDNCEDAPVDTLNIGETLTYEADNTDATATCEALGALGDTWHAFDLTADADVTGAHCGTDPVFGNAFIVIDPECPYSGAFIFATSFDQFTCADGNWAIHYDCLPAGDYWSPVMYDPGFGNEGKYVWNISADPSSCEGSNCCFPHEGVGCDDPECEALVCALDSFCCDIGWDQLCSDEAADLCELCTP